MRSEAAEQRFSPLDPFAQNAVAWEVCQQELHLVASDLPPLEIDVFCMGGAERNGKQLHTRLLRCSACLVIIAAFTGSDDVNPSVLATLAQRVDMIPGQQEIWKLLTTIKT